MSPLCRRQDHPSQNQLRNYRDNERRQVCALLYRSTIHGLNHVSTANSRWSKFFWLILFFTGIFGFTWNLVHIVERYYSYPVLTSYFSEYEPFVWPDITFCNPTAPYPLTNEYPELRKEWESLSNLSQKYLKEMNMSDNSIFKEIDPYADDFPTQSLITSTLSPTTFRLHEFHHHVKLAGLDQGNRGIYLTDDYQNSLNDLNESTAGTYTSTQFLQYRLNVPCHTVHLSEVQNIKNISQVEQILFIVLTNYQSYIYINDSYLFRGVFVHINYPNTLAQDDGILISPGFNNEIILTMSNSQFNSFKRGCREEKYFIELYDTSLTTTRTFEGSYDDCKKMVSQELYLQRCQCYNPFLPIFKSPQHPPQLCLNMSIFNSVQLHRNAECMLRVKKAFENETTFLSAIQEKCDRFLTKKCNSTYYNVNVNKDMWIELWTADFNDRRRQYIQSIASMFSLDNNTASEELKKNIAYLFVRRRSAYGDMVREDFEYPLSEMISDVGGLLGLWIGLSVVGMFEVVEFFILVIRLSYLRLFNRGERQQVLALAPQMIRCPSCGKCYESPFHSAPSGAMEISGPSSVYLPNHYNS